MLLGVDATLVAEDLGEGACQELGPSVGREAEVLARRALNVLGVTARRDRHALSPLFSVAISIRPKRSSQQASVIAAR